MSFTAFRKSTGADRSLEMTRARVSGMTPDELSAATPEGLSNSFGVSLEQANVLLANFSKLKRRG